MPNMSLQKHEMPSQAPDVRNKNFYEVTLGYTAETAIDEAKRCLNCKNKPCMGGCPVRIHIPEFIAKVAEGEFEEAYHIIQQTSSLPAVCGRVCPQETQCEQKCVRGIKGEPVAIGRLERFVADWHNANSCDLPVKAEPNGHKVAVVGSGPAGLTCAGDLAKRGYEVTRVRGAAPCGRRARVRHPRIPPAQADRTERDRQPHRPRRQGRDQHGHRPACSPSTS